MDVEILVAIISAVVTVGVAVWVRQKTEAFDARQASAKLATDERLSKQEAATQEGLARLQALLDEQSFDRRRALEAKDVVDRYRRPLMVAAEELRARLANITSQGFLTYLADDSHRGRIALRAPCIGSVDIWAGWRRCHVSSPT